MIKIAFILVALSWSVPAFANQCSQNNNEINGLVGVDGQDGRVYASITSTSAQCGCELVRFKPANSDTDKALTILMTAKITKAKLRIDFLEHGNCDSAYRVYLQ